MKISYKHEIKFEDKVTPEEILKLILKDRSIKNIDEFINPPLPQTINLSDFGTKFAKEFNKTISILEKIRKDDGMIVVYTDYDADGITGGTILWETLHLLGFKTMPYVPHRRLEGYGFSIKGIDTIKKQFNPSLVISVDHGITAKQKVSYAKSIGIPIVITDHHLKPIKLPTDAEAIFHISKLSGSGVAYVFAKEIFNHFSNNKKINPSIIKILSHNFEIDYPCLAAIGTVADLVPLIGPSRSIVKHGLDAFQKTKRVGLKAILQEAGIDGKPITPYEVGFIIAPRINAIGRLGHALDALRLLCTKDHKKAHELAQKIGMSNRERQDIVEKSVKEAMALVEKNKIIPKLILLVSEHWHEGIIGLIASKIAEKYYRPTIVMTKTDGYYKGSARSFPYLHITNFLRDLKEFLIDIGGHAGAAGFTIEQKKIKEFQKKIAINAEKIIKDKDLEKKLQADYKISLSKINPKLVKLIEKLQPFGIGNPQPTFYSDGNLIDAKIVGKTAKHLKIILNDPSFHHSMIHLLEGISFNSAEKFTQLSVNQEISIVYQLEINRWNGKEKVVGKILNIIMSENLD